MENSESKVLDSEALNSAESATVTKEPESRDQELIQDGVQDGGRMLRSATKRNDSAKVKKPSKSSKKKTSEFYAVRVGRTVGVFDSWTDAGASTNRFRGCLYRGWSTLQEAVVDLLSWGVTPDVYKNGVRHPLTVREYCAATGWTCRPTEDLKKEIWEKSSKAIHHAEDDDVSDDLDEDLIPDSPEDSQETTNTDSSPILHEILKNVKLVLQAKRDLKDFEALVVNQFSPESKDCKTVDYERRIDSMKQQMAELEAKLQEEETRSADRKKEKDHLEACLTRKNGEITKLKATSARETPCSACAAHKENLDLAAGQLAERVTQQAKTATEVASLTRDAEQMKRERDDWKQLYGRLDADYKELERLTDALSEELHKQEALRVKLFSELQLRREEEPVPVANSTFVTVSEAMQTAMEPDVVDVSDSPLPAAQSTDYYIDVSSGEDVLDNTEPEEVDLLVVGISHLEYFRTNGLLHGKTVKKICLENKTIMGALEYIHYECNVSTKNVYLHALDNDVLRRGVEECLIGVDELVKCCVNKFGPGVKVYMSEILPRALKSRSRERRYMRDAQKINFAMRRMDYITVVRQESLYDCSEGYYGEDGKFHGLYCGDGIHLTRSGLGRYVLYEFAKHLSERNDYTNPTIIMTPRRRLARNVKQMSLDTEHMPTNQLLSKFKNQASLDSKIEAIFEKNEAYERQSSEEELILVRDGRSEEVLVNGEVSPTSPVNRKTSTTVRFAGTVCGHCGHVIDSDNL